MARTSAVSAGVALAVCAGISLGLGVRRRQPVLGEVLCIPGNRDLPQVEC